jgi:hypothetical protein
LFAHKSTSSLFFQLISPKRKKKKGEKESSFKVIGGLNQIRAGAHLSIKAITAHTDTVEDEEVEEKPHAVTHFLYSSYF